MVKYLLAVSFMLLGSDIYAQNPDWQSITSMNDIRDLATYNQQIIAATGGGAYFYNPTDKSVKKFTNIEGLKSVNLKVVDVDTRGNILFGSAEGDIQQYNPLTASWFDIDFDGSDIKNFKIQGDTLWVASGAAVAAFLWKNDVWEFSDAFFNFPEIVSSITSIELFRGRIWLGTDIGLISAPSNFSLFTLSDPQNWKLISTINGLLDNSVQCLAGYFGHLWVGSEAGLSVLDNDTIISNIEFNSGVNVLYPKSNILHIANNTRYYTYNGSAFAVIQNMQSQITSLEVDESGIVWFGLLSAGIRNSNSGKSILIDGPYKSYVRFVIKDNQNRIWASTGKYKLTPREGYSVFENGIWTGHTFSGSRYTDIGNTDYIYQDRFNNIWFASWGGGIQVLTGEEYKYIHNHSNPGTRYITTFDTSFTISIPPVNDMYKDLLDNAPVTAEDYVVTTAIKEDFSGNLWIANPYAGNGNYIAVAPYKNDFIDVQADWTYFGKTDGITLNEGGISSIEFDDFGRVWIAAQETGIYVLDYNNTLTNKSDDQLFRLDINDNLYSSTVITMAKDHDGIIWIGSRAGLNSFDGVNVYKHVGDENGINGPISSSINQIVIDDYNNKWIATAGGISILRDGRSAFEQGSWVSYTTENSGLLNNLVHSIYVDSRTSEAIIGTETGISIFKGSFAEIQDNYKKVTGGPNPFVLSVNDNFVIKKLKANSSVRIFNINGKLIKNLTSDNSGVEGSRAIWDGKDRNGNFVPSGIYLYLAYTENGAATSGKIAVIKNNF